MDTFLDRGSLIERYRRIRQLSERLCHPLKDEDYVVQSLPDVSPIKWHLAHTTSFWEMFLLIPQVPDYRLFHSQYPVLFHTPYASFGEQDCQSGHAVFSRPTVIEIYQYRHYVDEQVLNVFKIFTEERLAQLASIIEFGLHHEQQHQESIIAGIKHVFFHSPFELVYRKRDPSAPLKWAFNQVYREQEPGAASELPSWRWIDFAGGFYAIGHEGEEFAFSNERPRHQQLLQPFRLASRLVTNREYLEFMRDGGYKDPLLWLDDGWRKAQRDNWQAPLYWENRDGEWWVMTLSGWQPVEPHEPVCHLSYYEADAYARWANARLPLESEWEIAAQGLSIRGTFVEDQRYHPAMLTARAASAPLAQMYGDVWEWTRSPYLPYPGYLWANDPLDEYHGRTSSIRLVLRGGSCATSRAHIRRTYRNFLRPASRWQFMGLRLAKDG